MYYSVNDAGILRKKEIRVLLLGVETETFRKVLGSTPDRRTPFTEYACVIHCVMHHFILFTKLKIFHHICSNQNRTMRNLYSGFLALVITILSRLINALLAPI